MPRLIKFVTILAVFISGFLNLSVADWVRVSNGLGNAVVYTLVSKDNLLFVGTNSGVFVSSDNGENWTQTSLNNEIIQSFFVKGNYLLAGASQHGVFVSKNNGASWIHSNLNYATVTSYMIYGNNILAGTLFYGLQMSTDNGESWTRISYNIQYVRSILEVGNDLIAGAYNNLSYNGIYRSTDNGVFWVETSFNPISVSLLEKTGNTIYAGTDDFNSSNNGLYASVDNGMSWVLTSLANNLHIDAMLINGDAMFLGTFQNGIFISTNNGASWIQRNEGLPANATSMNLTTHNNFLFTAIQLNGVYRRQLDELVGIHSASSEIPSSFLLSQNYPNPFNPTTLIEFSVPTQSHAELSIFDAKGSLIRTLFTGNLEAGKYSVDFDASGIGSGIYFYTLTAGDFRETKKMVLIK